MKKFWKIAATGVLVIGLGGCQTTQSALSLLSGNSIASQAPVVTMDVEKGLIVAHYAYDGLGQVIIQQAQPGGLIHGKTATEVQFYYDKAGDALDLADQADAAGNAEGVGNQINQVFTLIDKAKTLIPVK